MARLVSSAAGEEDHDELENPAVGRQNGNGQGADEQLGPYGEADVIHAAPDGTQKEAHQQQVQDNGERAANGEFLHLDINAKNQVVEKDGEKGPDLRQQEDPEPVNEEIPAAESAAEIVESGQGINHQTMSMQSP